MNYIRELIAMLALRTRAFRAMSERQALIPGLICFWCGFLVFITVRNTAYAYMLEFMVDPPNTIDYFSSVLKATLFILVVYIPSAIILSNAFSGDGLGLSISRQEYRSHASVLLPLWGCIFLIVSPLQYFAPTTRVAGYIEYSIPMIVLLLLLIVYTVSAIKHLNYFSVFQAVGVFLLSGVALPVYFFISSFFFGLPLFILIPLVYFGYRWIQDYFGTHGNEQTFRKNLHTLTINPQDADAHYQLGMIHLKRRDATAAKKSFLSALAITSDEPEYHYALGRVYEQDGEWTEALEQYEETYRLNPEFRTGDIIREVGKGYLHAGNIEKGAEFLGFFLERRNDPEGRYWLAIAMQKSGHDEQMRVHLAMVLEQARSSPRFFRKGNRQWIYRARNMLRESRS
jgi:tetratricopeptide (TPR) repeat protein